jgi:VWFA-related protein
VTALQPENFTVYEDGKPQTISSAVSGDTPACVGLLVDRSGSMRGRHAAIAAAMGDFVRAGNPGNQYFVVLFSDEASLQQEFTADAGLIEQAISSAEARGGTAFYDSLIATADHLAENKACGKRALVMVSDGKDNESRKSLEFALRALQDDGNPLVYTFGMPPLNGPEPLGRKVLEMLSAQSGGEAFFAESLGGLRKVALRAAEEIRGQYSITYESPVNLSDPKIKVETRAAGKKDLTVRVNVVRPVVHARGVASPPVRASAVPQGSSCISGSLVDQDKKPVSGIRVEAWPLFRPNPYSQNSYPFSITDESGNFKIGELPNGRFRIYTKKEENAGLLGTPLVYRSQDSPIAFSSESCASVVVHFPTKFTKLWITVVNATTRTAIPDYGITLERPGAFPMVIPHANPRVGILVPAHIELTLHAWVDRYTRSVPVTITTPDADASQQLTIELDTRKQALAYKGSDE